MRLPAITTRVASLIKRGCRRYLHNTPKDQRILAEMDYFRLHALLTAESKAKNRSAEKNKKKLRQILKQGRLFPFKLVPHSVVTMNSEVQIRTPRGSTINVTLVYPKDHDRKKKKISVLSLLGLSILGRHVGQTVSRSVVVEGILLQPEISNRFML